MRRQVHELLYRAAFEILDVDSPSIRYLPVTFYISSGTRDRRDYVLEALSKLLEGIEFRLIDEYEEQRGSLFKRLIFESKKILTRSEVKERVEGLERALQLRGIHKTQAEVNKLNAESAKALCEALGQDGFARIGSVYVMRISDGSGKPKTIIGELTQEQLRLVEARGPRLMTPQEFMDILSIAPVSEEGRPAIKRLEGPK